MAWWKEMFLGDLTWWQNLLMFAGGAVLMGNYVYWLFIAKKIKGPPSEQKPSRFPASETVWYDGE